MIKRNGKLRMQLNVWNILHNHLMLLLFLLIAMEWWILWSNHPLLKRNRKQKLCSEDNFKWGDLMETPFINTLLCLWKEEYQGKIILNYEKMITIVFKIQVFDISQFFPQWRKNKLKYESTAREDWVSHLSNHYGLFICLISLEVFSISIHGRQSSIGRT